MPQYVLDFEKPIFELINKIEELRQFSSGQDLDFVEEIKKLEKKADKLQTEVFTNLTTWQRVQLARHPNRPYSLDYIKHIFGDIVELHGDRAFAEDRAVVGGLVKLDGMPLVVIGQQKGRDTKEKLLRNFGMAHPEGYRKALRLMKMAEKFKKPVLCIVDTPGAYPGIGAEERGQAEAIARNLREMSLLKVPIIVAVIGEGGSGGALALGVGDVVMMMEYSIYSVISPEGCASILWRDPIKAPEAAEAMNITAPHLLRLRLVDEIVPEPPGGSHRDHALAAENLKARLIYHYNILNQKTLDQLLEDRYQKFRRMGVFIEG